MLFLLQVAENKISLFSLLQKGGYIMYPLYLLLVIAIYVFFERMIAIKKQEPLILSSCLLFVIILFQEI